MNLRLTIKQNWIDSVSRLFRKYPAEYWIAGISTILAVIATWISFKHGWIVAYGDAESHLNIAKRVVESLTPGFAQLGGIWLPLPHLLLIPFVLSDYLWRTGLAGSIVSGVAFIVTSVFLYKLVFTLTKNTPAAFLGAVAFMINPNVLYLQSTPMTELTLIVFSVLSTYYFVRYLQQSDKITYLLASAFFGFLAALSRYDGWFLVVIEGAVIVLMNIPWGYPLSQWKIKEIWKKTEGKLVMFSTLAAFGIILWLLWGYLILGDPLYFTHSQFSAKSQQASWLARGELPAYKHLGLSVLYYIVTSMSNIGVIMFLLAVAGFVYYLWNREDKNRFYIMLVLLAPFVFNVVTLYMGQSVIFIPSLTPVGYDWRLFNVRYGVMMVPTAAVCIGYLFYKSKHLLTKIIIGFLCVAQLGLYVVGYSSIITLADGTVGLSSSVSKLPDAQNFLNAHYDHGLVLEDDFARTISIIRTDIPMQDIIYVGNKPYWEDSLVEPEKYATWIVMQRNDDVWTHIYDDPGVQARLYKYFDKVYTSPDILIFRRNDSVPAGS